MKYQGTTKNPLSSKMTYVFKIGFKEAMEKFKMSEDDLNGIRAIVFEIEEPQYEIERKLIK